MRPLCEAIIFKRVWSPAAKDLLLEEDNDHDRFAVCVVKGELIVGRVP